MNKIKLISPTFKYKNALKKLKQEFFDNNEEVINGSSLFDQMNFNNWLEHVENSSHISTIKENWVVSSSFVAIRENDNKIIGMIDIRHNINNDFLSKYGGHIGYSVRPSERKKGYATNMLKLALDHSKTIGLSKVMLGCFSDNIPSKKTIEKCGGILTETKPYIDGNLMDVYWITF